MAKTTEQLLQQAVQIRDEQANKKNTALRVGTLFSDIIEKQEESDQTHATDVTKINEAVTENSEKVTNLNKNTGISGYPVWKPNTAYAKGAVILNPNGQLVKNTVEQLDSGGTYNPVLWETTSLDKVNREKVAELEDNLGLLTYTLFSVNSKQLTIDGTIESSPVACITEYIPYSSGDITVRGISGVRTCLLHFYDANKTFISAISGSDKNDVLVTIKKNEIPTNTKYIRACGNADESGSIKSNFINVIDIKSINDNSNKIFGLLDYVNVSNYINWVWRNDRYVTPEGTIGTLGNTRLSEPVFVYKGDEVIVRGNGLNMPLICEYLQDEDKYNVLLRINTEEIKTYSYIAEKDMYIAICGRYNRTEGNITGCIRRNIHILELKESINNDIAGIKEKTDNFINDANIFVNLYGYINANGDVTGNPEGQIAYTDYIPYVGGDIKVRGFSGELSTCLLAFYDIDRKFISCIIGSEYNDVDVTINKEDIPMNTRYVRANASAINGVPNSYCYLSTISINSIHKHILPSFNTSPFTIFNIFINESGGESGNEDTCCTDFLLYNGEDIIVQGFSGNIVMLVAYYDKDKQFIGYVNGLDKDNVLVTIKKEDVPSNTFFIRATGKKERINYINMTDSKYYNTKIFLEHGKIGSDGKNVGVCDSNDFYNNLISAHPYKVCENLKVYNLSSYQLTFFWYDKSMNLLTTSTDIIEGAAFFKIMLSSDYKIEAKPTVITNAIAFKNVAADTAFTYEVPFVKYEVTNDFDNIKSALTDTTEVKYDRGYIMFPPNYSQSGDPCKLAIFCQGSGGLRFGINAVPYKDFCQYICNEGYVVMMICGVTDYYYDKYYAPYYPEDYLDHLCTPIAMDCYKAAYDYVYRNYNIERQCVAWGKSIGGATTLALTNRREIPLVAIGGHAPVCDIVGEVLRNRQKQYKEYYSEAFGMTGEVNWKETQGTTEEEQEYWKANIDKVNSYNPIYASSVGLNITDAITAEFQCPVNTRNREDYTTLENVYKNISKLNIVPYKIWIAPDDDQLSVWRPYFVYKMCLNANQNVELRLMPENTGGHNSTDTGNGVNHEGEEPIKATVTPRYSNQPVEMPIAYIELVAWWRRFGG